MFVHNDYLTKAAMQTSTVLHLVPNCFVRLDVCLQLDLRNSK